MINRILCFVVILTIAFSGLPVKSSESFVLILPSLDSPPVKKNDSKKRSSKKRSQSSQNKSIRHKNIPFNIFDKTVLESRIYIGMPSGTISDLISRGGSMPRQSDYRLHRSQSSSSSKRFHPRHSGDGKSFEDRTPPKRQKERGARRSDKILIYDDSSKKSQEDLFDNTPPKSPIFTRGAYLYLLEDDYLSLDMDLFSDSDLSAIMLSDDEEPWFDGGLIGSFQSQSFKSILNILDKKEDILGIFNNDQNAAIKKTSKEEEGEKEGILRSDNVGVGRSSNAPISFLGWINDAFFNLNEFYEKKVLGNKHDNDWKELLKEPYLKTARSFEDLYEEARYKGYKGIFSDVFKVKAQDLFQDFNDLFAKKNQLDSGEDLLFERSKTSMKKMNRFIEEPAIEEIARKSIARKEWEDLPQ